MKQQPIELVQAVRWTESRDFPDRRVTFTKKMHKGKVAILLPLGVRDIGETFNAQKAFEELALANGFKKTRKAKNGGAA